LDATATGCYRPAGDCCGYSGVIDLKKEYVLNIFDHEGKVKVESWRIEGSMVSVAANEFTDISSAMSYIERLLVTGIAWVGHANLARMNVEEKYLDYIGKAEKDCPVLNIRRKPLPRSRHAERVQANPVL
jgi:hypothetical protein